MIANKTEGITLQSIAYKDNQRIITIFTKDKGIISVILKNLSSKKPLHLALTAPFCLAEIVYKQSKSDIFFLKDAEILDENLDLRKDLSYINSAYFMAKAILNSQLPQKNAHILYQLLLSYLKKIPYVSSQDALIISFLLKILSHEGLIHLNHTCNLCSENASVIHKGESLCVNHASMHAHKFSNVEISIMQKLITVKSFKSLDKIECSADLKDKTRHLFEELIK